MSLGDREQVTDEPVVTEYERGAGLVVGLTATGTEVWVGIEYGHGVLVVHCDPDHARDVANALIELAGEAENNV